MSFHSEDIRNQGWDIPGPPCFGVSGNGPLRERASQETGLLGNGSLASEGLRARRQGKRALPSKSSSALPAAPPRSRAPCWRGQRLRGRLLACWAEGRAVASSRSVRVSHDLRTREEQAPSSQHGHADHAHASSHRLHDVSLMASKLHAPSPPSTSRFYKCLQ
jgi:hypothetical protein